MSELFVNMKYHDKYMEDTVNFVQYPGNPLFQNGGGIDVKFINNQFYMLQEGQSGATLSVRYSFPIFLNF